MAELKDRGVKVVVWLSEDNKERLKEAIKSHNEKNITQTNQSIIVRNAFADFVEKWQSTQIEVH